MQVRYRLKLYFLTTLNNDSDLILVGFLFYFVLSPNGLSFLFVVTNTPQKQLCSIGFQGTVMRKDVVNSLVQTILGSWKDPRTRGGGISAKPMSKWNHLGICLICLDCIITGIKLQCINFFLNSSIWLELCNVIVLDLFVLQIALWIHLLLVGAVSVNKIINKNGNV